MTAPQHRVRTLWLLGVLHAFTHAYHVALLPLYLPMQRDLKLASLEQATLPMTVMMLVYYGLSYPLGILADRMSRKKLLGWGLFINALGFVGLVLLIGAALAIIGDLIGIATQNPEATAPMMLIPQLTLGLASVGLQPVERFPEWIQGFVRNQPLSQWVYGLQALAGDSTGAAPEATLSVLGPGILWAVGCIVIALALHIWVSGKRRSS